jgi:DNA-directed RNA polymerase sigma subunit (sigma70/sigma32)
VLVLFSAGNPERLADIAVSGERIRQIEAKALEKMRKALPAPI